MFSHHFSFLLLVLWVKSLAISFVHCNDFFDLTTQPYFVDKSDLLVETFNRIAIPPPGTSWNFSSINYCFFTRPPGFGKTTYLKMIQSFAQYELGEDNVTKPYNETRAYEVFSKLKISKFEPVFSQNLAQYSVIYLDLTFQAEDLVDKDTAAAAFAAKFFDIFKPYEWFMKNITQEGAHTFLVSLLASKVDPEWIHRCAFYVCKTLSRIGGKGTLFLVDNFDSAVRVSVSKPGLKAVDYLYKLIHKTLGEFVKFIRTENIDHRRSLSLIAGVSGMRFNFDEYHTAKIYRRSVFLRDGLFSRHIGFVQQDVHELLNKFNCSEEEKTRVKTYYKGYKMDSEEVFLYNPVSITEYVKSKLTAEGVGKLQPYWAQNVSLDFVADFAKAPWFGKKLSELVAKNEIQITSPIYKQEWSILMCFFEGAGRNYQSIIDDDAPLLLYYFYEHGFLRHKDQNPWYVFEFANAEVQSEVTRRLREMGVAV